MDRAEKPFGGRVQDNRVRNFLNRHEGMLINYVTEHSLSGTVGGQKLTITFLVTDKDMEG